MEKMMKECLKPHPLLHLVSGVGLGLLIASFIPGLGGSTGALLGIVLVIAGVAGEFMMPPKGRK